jgi:hypothetical protein
MSDEEKENDFNGQDAYKVSKFNYPRTSTLKGKVIKLDSTLLGFQPSNIIENEVGSESSKNYDNYQSFGK